MGQNIISGFLFDSYCSSYDNNMTFWIKKYDAKDDDIINNNKNNMDTENSCICIKDTKWRNYFYIAYDEHQNNISLVQKIIENEKIASFIESYEYVSRQEKITEIYNQKSRKNSKILKLYLVPSFSSYFHRTQLANMIEKIADFQKIRLYNVDLLPDQQYFFDNDIFPFGEFDVCGNNYHSSSDKNNNKQDYALVWNRSSNESIELTDYVLPSFTNIHISINFQQQRGKIIKYTDELKSITLQNFDYQNNRQNILDNNKKEEIVGTEKDILKDLVKIIDKRDPDFVFTDDGDSFTFPYLAYRAKENNIKLYLGRDKNISLHFTKIKDGISYFSYGRMYYRPSPIRLHGRIHIDLSNSFLFSHDSNLHGLFEISRLCRIPMHHASRATIGRCLTSIHLYTATKRGLLIPWKPILSEHVKTLRELFIADRGGLTLEPEIGVHENIAEFDFASLYPNIMVKKNISAETIRCVCCLNKSTSKVPELGYHICKKKGLVSESLETVLKKRALYKNLKKKTNDPLLKDIYDQRQSALKWILVTSFGYLGFNNAKFGRIDAHIAVCAFARDILLKTMYIAENNGFNVLHGIIDSIWVKKDGITNKNNENHVHYAMLKEEVEKKVGFEISFEGIYKWIVFLTSKTHENVGVVNRYFGVFDDGTIKVRGLEIRRHDTPAFFSKCQYEVLEIMAKGDSMQQVQELFPVIKKRVEEYLSMLKTRKVAIEDLVFTKLLSKDYDEYQNRNTVERSAIKQLEMKGCYMKKGQTLQYIITGNHDKFLKKAIPLQLADDNTRYDVKRYCELLLEAVNVLLDPFGIPINEDIKMMESKITDF